VSKPGTHARAYIHRQPDWKLIFWDAKIFDSALGILADCILGNVSPTGNRGLPLAPSRRWAGSRESRVREEQKLKAQCASEGVYVRSVSGRELASKTGDFTCPRKEVGCQAVGVCAKWRRSMHVQGECLLGRMCVQRRGR
jgi:hypothetical protein